MKIRLISVGNKMPAWVQAGTIEYEKRCSQFLGFSVSEVPMVKRTKTVSIEQCVLKESEELLSRLHQDDYVVALEVMGKSISTEALAHRIERFRLEGTNLSLLVGGPDGMSDACRDRANECWSLSSLTLPHPLVRVLIAEQMFRVSSILQGHPYHRE